MIIWITLGSMFVLVVALAIVLSRRGGTPPHGDDEWRDAGFQPGNSATRPFGNPPGGG